jgi:hypothetical protein
MSVPKSMISRESKLNFEKCDKIRRPDYPQKKLFQQDPKKFFKKWPSGKREDAKKGFFNSLNIGWCGFERQWHKFRVVVASTSVLRSNFILCLSNRTAVCYAAQARVPDKKGRGL